MKYQNVDGHGSDVFHSMYFDSADGGSILLRNTDIHLQDSALSIEKRSQYGQGGKLFTNI